MGSVRWRTSYDGGQVDVAFVLATSSLSSFVCLHCASRASGGSNRSPLGSDVFRVTGYLQQSCHFLDGFQYFSAVDFVEDLPVPSIRCESGGWNSWGVDRVPMETCSWPPQPRKRLQQRTLRFRSFAQSPVASETQIPKGKRRKMAGITIHQNVNSGGSGSFGSQMVWCSECRISVYDPVGHRETFRVAQGSPHLSVGPTFWRLYPRLYSIVLLLRL